MRLNEWIQMAAKGAVALALVLGSLTATKAVADDWNLDTYQLKLYPSDVSPIRLYGLDGGYLGELTSESKIVLNVSGDLVRSSLVNGTPDIPTIIRQASYRDVNGNYAMQLSLGVDVVTKEGTTVRAGTQFRVSTQDFLSISTEQQSAPPPPPQTNYNTNISTEPIGDGSNVDEFGEDDGSNPVDKDGDEDNAQGQDFATDLSTARGAPFPRGGVFSSPLCDCGPSCRVSSGFGRRSSRRTTNGRRMTHNHMGVDFASPIGTHVLAAADGCVAAMGTNPNSGNGLFITLAHGNGLESQYLHLNRLATSVRGGACFHRGDLIGYVGDTGNVTGPNLHFEVKLNHVPVNPMNYIIAAAKPPMAFRVRCDNVPSYPVLDEAMANALASSPSSSRRTGSSR